MSSVSADTVRMRRMPFRYSGDMCCSPSTSLPAARWARTSSSVRGASSSTVAVMPLLTCDKELTSARVSSTLRTVKLGEETPVSIQTLIEAGPFIAGTAESLSGERREITNPGTGELVGRVTDSTARDADRAVQAAQAAFKDWARLAYADRGRIIHACAEAFEAHVDELTPILVAEQGKTMREAKIELRKAADTLEPYAGLSRQVRGVSVHNVDPGVEGRVYRRPLGVVAAI